MRDIFKAGYMSFYRIAIGIIWAIAILLALAQSEFFTKALIRFAISGSDVQIGAIEGSIFREVLLKDICFEDLKIKELTINLNPVVYDNGIFRLDAIIINEPSAPQKWIDKQLESNGTTPSWLKGVGIDTIVLNLKNFEYDDINISSLNLKAKDFFTDLKTAKLDFEINSVSNIAKINAKGNFKEGNYSLAGTLSGVSGGIVDKEADDVDFSFEALKDTPFWLKGDDKALHGVFDIENTDVFYKFDIDAKIIKARAQLDMNLSNTHLTINTIGTLSSRYAVADTEFVVKYDGKTTYEGEAFVKEVLYVPLGVFAPNVTVQNPKITNASFKGTVKDLHVEASGNTNAIIVDDEPVRVKELNAVVDYIFRGKDLKVTANASALCNYGDLNTSVNVTQKNLGKVRFNGSVFMPNLSVAVPRSYVAEGTFNGDDDRLNAAVTLDDGGIITTNTTDYKNFAFTFSNQKLNLGKLFNLSDRFYGSFANLKGSGNYNNPNKLWNVNAKIIDGNILKRKLASQDIKFSVIQNKTIDLVPSKLSIGNTKIDISANANDKHFFTAKAATNGATFSANGVFRPLNIDLALDINDLSAIKNGFGDILDIEKEIVEGSAHAKAKVYKENNATTVSADITAKKMGLGEADIFDFNSSIYYSDNKLWLTKLDGFLFRNKIWAKSVEPIEFFTDKSVKVGTITVNGGKGDVTGKGSLATDTLELNILAKDFYYLSTRYGSGSLSGDIKVAFSGKKLNITGTTSVEDLDITYKPPTLSIPYDKDILIVKNSKSLLASSWFTQNCYINLGVTTKQAATYESKDANLSFDIKGNVLKEYDRRIGFNGKIALHGDYFAVGKIFKIENGHATVRYGDEENPFINAKLVYVNSGDNITIYVFVNGRQKNPTITFASNPPMNERDMLSYLAFGVNSNQSVSSEGSQAQNSAQAIAMLSTYLSRNILGELGARINSVNVGDSDKQVGASKVEVGASLTKNVSIIYQQDVDSRVGVRYNFTPNIGAQMTSGQNGSALEGFYKYDY